MLNKQNAFINFAKAINTKTDPLQLAIGEFADLENVVFNKGGQLQKRNGYTQLASLPQTNATFLTTFNSNLTAIGTTLQAYAASTNSWSNQGSILPVDVATLPLVRSSTNQTQSDSATSANGQVCVVYTDSVPVSGTLTNFYKYAVLDSTTGQSIKAPTLITDGANTVNGAPKVFYLGIYFIIVFPVSVSGTPNLKYIAINSITGQVGSAVVLTTSFSTSNAYSINAFDGAIYNNRLYLAWNGAGSSGIKMLTLSNVLSISSTVVLDSAHTATLVSVCCDLIYGTIWTAYYDGYTSGTGNGYVVARDQNLNVILTPTKIIAGAASATSVGILNLATSASNHLLTVFQEGNIPTAGLNCDGSSYILTTTVTQSGTVTHETTISSTPYLTSNNVLVRSVGLASKAFLYNNEIYFIGVYNSATQPTYFLFSQAGTIYARFAYSNGGGYDRNGLPSVSLDGNLAQVSYRYKDLIEAVNKSINPTSSSAVYSQTGINLISLTIGSVAISSVEIGNNLNITGGFMWMYDGVTPVEQNFNVWPDMTTPPVISSSGGGMSSQTYYYQAVYEWTDNQGNLFRSAPSIPLLATANQVTPSGVTFSAVFSSGSTTMSVSSATGLFLGQIITDTTTSGNIVSGTTITNISGTTVTVSNPFAGSSASSPGDTLATADTISVTVDIPTARITYKIASPIKLTLYRWSSTNQIFYQTTSILNPILNDVTQDFISYTDTANDNEIIGNDIIYTNGGVVEDICPPATNLLALFKSRLVLVDAEDPNLLWYSKQVIEGTPVEMSDLFTIYVAPTTGAQGSTGPTSAISAMDDKLIVFKKDAIYYLTGDGPDNTGANNDFSDPIFITSTVGCANQRSIVFMPGGLMFQSDKGIWLLGRDLSTQYIGAPVENFTLSAQVQSAVNVPGTNQVRFTLDTGITLVYDYYYGLWGTFTNVPAISSTLYNSLHTFINANGAAFQESPGVYLDGFSPVLMGFTTGWLNLAGIDGYQRAYYLQLITTYMSPHFLNVQIAYDYQSDPTQSSLIQPINYNEPYGDDPLYGSTMPYGGNSTLERWRVFLQRQRSQAIQLTITEIFNPQYGTVAGAGLTFTGMNVIYGVKKGWFPSPTSQSVG